MAAHPEHCPRAPEEKWAGIVSLIGVVAVEQDAIEMQREGEMGSGAQLESAVDDGAPAFADAACRRKAAGRMEATQYASDHVVG